MVNRYTLALQGLALASAMLPRVARADDTSRVPRPRGSVAFVFGNASINHSSYRATVSNWGFDGFRSYFSVALDGGAFVTPWLLVGGRLGYGRTGGGNPTGLDGELKLSMVDAGLVVRVGFPIATSGTRWFLGAQGECGAVLATVSLRDEDQRTVLPRFGAGAFAQVFLGRFGLGLRVVQRFASWSDAGGRTIDLDLGGLEISGSVEVRL